MGWGRVVWGEVQVTTSHHTANTQTDTDIDTNTCQQNKETGIPAPQRPHYLCSVRALW